MNTWPRSIISNKIFLHIQTVGSAQFEYNLGRRAEKEKWTLLIQSAHMIQAPILILGVVVVFHALLYCFRLYTFRHAHHIRVTLIFKKVAFLKLITRIKSFRKDPISDVPKMEKHENLLMIHKSQSYFLYHPNLNHITK